MSFSIITFNGRIFIRQGLVEVTILEACEPVLASLIPFKRRGKEDFWKIFLNPECPVEAHVKTWRVEPCRPTNLFYQDFLSDTFPN
jgi:hypothetical protein